MLLSDGYLLFKTGFAGFLSALQKNSLVSKCGNDPHDQEYLNIFKKGISVL